MAATTTSIAPNRNDRGSGVPTMSSTLRISPYHPMLIIGMFLTWELLVRLDIVPVYL